MDTPSHELPQIPDVEGENDTSQAQNDTSEKLADPKLETVEYRYPPEMTDRFKDIVEYLTEHLDRPTEVVILPYRRAERITLAYNWCIMRLYFLWREGGLNSENSIQVSLGVCKEIVRFVDSFSNDNFRALTFAIVSIKEAPINDDTTS